MKLPTSYKLVGPSKVGKPEPPNSTQSKISKSTHVNGSVVDAMEWLQQLSKPDDEIKKGCSLSSFYSKDKENRNVVAITQLLPILPESINSCAMVCHCSKVIVVITSKLNPGQQPVITADQPVYSF